MAIPNPVSVSKMVDMMEQNPDASIDVTEDPALEEAIMKEVARRNEAVRVRGIIDTANKTAQKAIDKAARPNQAESAAAGYLQGGTIGFGEEILGSATALAGDPSQEPMLTPDGYDLNPQVFEPTYGQRRKQEVSAMRGMNKQFHDTNPGAYTAGEVAGMVASPVNKLAPAAPRGASLGQKIATGIEGGLPLGAAAAAGYSEADDVSGVLSDSMTGAGLGGAAGGVFAGLGHGVGIGLDKASRAGFFDSMVAAWLGIPQEAVRKYKNTGTWKELIDIVRGNAGSFGGAGQTAENIAGRTGKTPGFDGPVSIPAPGKELPTELIVEELPSVGKFNQRSLDSAYEQAYMRKSPMSAMDVVPEGPAPEINLGNKTPPRDLAPAGEGPMMPPPSGKSLTDASGREWTLAPPGYKTHPKQWSDPGLENQVPVGKPVPTALERDAVGYLDKVADSARGFDSKTGMQTNSLWGAMGATAKDRAFPTMGVGLPRLLSKMRDIVIKNQISRGQSSVAGGKLMMLIDAVEKSDKPELEDYLAKESSPEYNKVMLEAQHEIEKEGK